MSTIHVMINGLPGNVTTVIARHFIADGRFKVLPYAFTGPDIDAKEVVVDSLTIELIRPEAREVRMAAIIAAQPPFITVDFTHPTAVNANAEFYCRHKLPFVMGTTGGDRERLLASVVASDNVAVIAPNMAKQIVGFQAMMTYAAENFPNLFKGYRLTIRESHQAGKADTSGTAKAMVTCFNRMGIPFGPDQIEKERDPERQLNLWGVPPSHLSGHAWHTYALVSPDSTVRFEFTHNVNGRDVYGDGTKDAVCFLADKIAQGIRGKAFSMIDVLKAGAAL